ncbi:MAG: hypothetical protein Q4G58_10205 [bacterium]|nr:hypothetical protein [bacterium]
MEEKLMEEETIIQNLKDAGCSTQLITDFIEETRKEHTAEQLHILSRHRALLLQQIHSYNAKLDCLDYLIYKIKD